MSSALLSDLLFDRAKLEPRREYVSHKGQTFSYADFASLVHQMASQIEAHQWGGKAGVIGVSTDDPVQLLCTVWACALSGRSLAFCPQIDDVDTLERAMDQVGVVTLLTNRTALLTNARAVSLDGALALNEATAQRRDAITSASSQAAFLFQTSGTSGEPKWVRCEHWKCFEVVECMWREGILEHAVDQVVFLTAPLFHSYGLSSCFEYTRAGATLVLPSGDSPLGPVGELRKSTLATQVTAIEGVPNFHFQLSQLIERLSLPSLRHVGFGGGGLDQVTVNRLTKRHPELTISVRYGLTETPSVVAHKLFRPPYDADWKISGRVVSIYELQIVGSEGERLPPGQEGEIVVSGDCVCGYVGHALAPAMKTGDMGYLTAAGELIVVGRGSAFLKYRGYRLSPEQIESVIRTFADIEDCRALVRDERLVVEVVTVSPDFSRGALLNHIKSRLPLHAIPEDILVVEAIARTASGKIKRH